MRRIEISFEDILKNLNKNKKGMLIIFLGLLFAGAVCGYLDVRSFKQEPYNPEDTTVQKADLGHLKKDETYYYQAFMELKEKSSGLNAYIQYLKQVNLNGESMNKVSELEAAALEEQKKFAKLQEFYIIGKPIICDDLNAAKQFVRQKQEVAELRKDKAQKVLEELGEKAEGKDRNLKIYAEQEIGIWEDYLTKIESSNLDELQKINNEMDLLLEEEAESINMLVERFNGLITDIEANEQYEVLYNPYLLREYCDMAGIVGELYREDVVNERKYKALVYARSIAGVDSREERFYAVLTFSALLGVAFSLLYGSVGLRFIFPKLFRGPIAGLYRRKK